MGFILDGIICSVGLVVGVRVIKLAFKGTNVLFDSLEGLMDRKNKDKKDKKD